MVLPATRLAATLARRATRRVLVEAGEADRFLATGDVFRRAARDFPSWSENRQSLGTPVEHRA